MIRACEAAGVPLFVAYYRRAMPRFRTVATLLADGAVGDLRAVTVRTTSAPQMWDPGHLPWRVLPEIAGGGLFVDLGSHTLDLLDHLLGPLSEVRGTAVNLGGHYPAEDTVTMTFRAGTGDAAVEGVGLWCFAAHERTDQVTLVGSRGTLRFSTFGDEPLRLTTAAGERAIEAPRPATVQLPLIQTVVDALRGVGECPSTGGTALRTAEVVDTVLAGYRDRASLGS